MKLYLAGKVGMNDWRHDVVPNLRSISVVNDDSVVDHWPATPTTWPGVVYTGPYFTGCDHGCAHVPGGHGFVADGCIVDDTEFLTRRALLARCYRAIEKCDTFFAWLDDLTAFGTLVEIGYAKALGKRPIIATPHAPLFDRCGCGHGCNGCNGNPLRELWFGVLSADVLLTANTPGDALEQVVSAWREVHEGERLAALLESPIERRFWAEHKRLSLPELTGLLPQCSVLGGRYRLDFALPDIKVAVELDGYEFHSSKEAFVKDRARQRELEAAGWRVIRFAGSEVHRDAADCVRQAAALVGRP